jgi:ABC-type branched-subunit amino acid transport system ATPase component
MLTSAADARIPGHLVVAGLAAGYNRTPIIRDVSLTVGRGEVVTVVGPNGAGKSTLVKAIMGVLGALEGEVRLGEAKLSGLRADQVARVGVGYVPQVRDVFESLTVRENLEMGAKTVPRRAIAEHLEGVIEAYPQLAGLLKRDAGKLSGGERKMVAIGRVLMTKPSVVILDEPTAGLSPKLASQLLESYVSGLASRGAAVLLIEQRARQALGISDFAYVMASGEVRIACPAAELLARDDLGQVFLGGGGSEKGRARQIATSQHQLGGEVAPK